MIFTLNTSRKLQPSDVSTIIDLTLNGKTIVSNDDYKSIILYTKKDTIKAKTTTQKEYV